MRGSGAVRPPWSLPLVMRDVLDILLEIILAIAGAVFFGSLAVVAVALLIGCAVFGGCWTWLGWRRRRRRAARTRKPD